MENTEKKPKRICGTYYNKYSQMFFIDLDTAFFMTPGDRQDPDISKIDSLPELYTTLILKLSDLSNRCNYNYLIRTMLPIQKICEITYMMKKKYITPKSEVTP